MLSYSDPFWDILFPLIYLITYAPLEGARSVNRGSGIVFSSGFPPTKNRLPFGQAVVSARFQYRSGHSQLHNSIPGPRQPLDPVYLRHVLTNHSALLAEGIFIPRSSYGLLIKFKLYVWICSIAFPFRTSSPSLFLRPL